MTSPRAIAIADLVTTELNSGAWGLPAQNATRVYVIRKDLKALPAAGAGIGAGNPFVQVAAADEDSEVLTRKDSRFDFEIHVSIQQKVDPTDPTQVDPILLLADRYCDHFRRMILGPCVCMQAGKLALWVPEHLDVKKVCTSIVRLNFIQVDGV